MDNKFSRTELLIGKESIEKLGKAKIAVFGVGGVGSFVLEGLIRSGVMNFLIVDNDTVDISNLNRQIHATNKTIGKYKVDVMKERMLEINPNANILTYKEFFMPSSDNSIITDDITYIVDAIDTVVAKLELISRANKLNIPIISSMGTGNKLDPTKLEIDDIYNTSVCPLARVIRKELRKRNIPKLKVVYSKEEPVKLKVESKVPGSMSFVPSVAGMIIASEIVKDIIEK